MSRARRLSIAAGAIILAGYSLALIKCECGLLAPREALQAVLPWWAIRYFLLIPVVLMGVEALLVGWHNSSLAVILRWSPSVRVDAFYLAMQIWLVPVP